MKRERRYSRFLNSVCVIFSLTIFAFGEDVDLSIYDNTHYAKEFPVEVKTIHPVVPNSGEIPSDANGEHIGIILYGGRGTRVNAFGGIRPNDLDGNGTSNGAPNAWYGENGKKQVIDFSTMTLGSYDISHTQQLRFGGKGSYVFGDIVTGGSPVLEPMDRPYISLSSRNMLNPVPDRSWNAPFINDGKIGGAFNSTTDTIKLPKGVKKEDIIFARLYWFGNLFPDNSLTDSFGNKNCDEKDNAEAAKKGKTCRRMPKVLKIDGIKGYQDVKLKVGDSKVYNLTVDKTQKDKIKAIENNNGVCQGIFSYNSSFFTQEAGNQRYNMNYICAIDIINEVKDNFKNGTTNLDISVGNVKATNLDPSHDYPDDPYGNQIWSRADANEANSYEGGFMGGLNGSGLAANHQLPFGGWYVALVYDKTMRAREEAKQAGLLTQEELDTYYKAKNVTLYDGYGEIQPTGDVNNVTVDFILDGFFTPKHGDVQGKIIWASGGAEWGPHNVAPQYGKREALYVSREPGNFNMENSKDNKNMLRNPANPYEGSPLNGTKSRYVIGENGNYVFEGPTISDVLARNGSYNQGFDLDEYDISSNSESKFLTNGQSTLALRAYVSKFDPNGNPGGGWHQRAFIPFIGMSIDLYIPQLCYEQKMYDTQGWLGFYNLDGTPITGHAQVEDVQVVTGENLYYRTEIRNKTEGGEDASKVWVKVNTGLSNDYVPNSSGIDNRLELTGLDGIDSAKFVYLQDNTPGVFSTQANRAAGTNKDKDLGEDKEIYEGKQFNTVQNRELKFYIGEDAGTIGTSGEPIGGDLEKGESAYIEFNATVGRTFTYTPIRYTVGYAMELGGQVVQGPSSIMERCETKENEVKIALLNGLKVVNQNFKDYGDTASDKNKTLSQDDRLYTQVAELPFDINVIFKPDINDVFKKYCVEKNSKGECYYQSDSFDICENYSGIFEKTEDGKCKAKKYKKLPDGTLGIDYGKEGELDGTLQNFPLPGKLYLSAIRNGSGCKYIDNRLKLPFKINGTRYMTDYDTGFMGYQESKKKKVMPIEKVEFEDAFSGVTFMFSYYPRGLNSPDTDTTLFVGDWNSTVAYDYNRTNDTWVEVEFDPEDEKSIEKYYIWLQTQMLYKKYIPGYSLSLSEDRKRELIREFFKKDNDGNFINADKIAKFDEELETIKDEINDASAFFGVEMSPDGSFHVCDSDSFVVRPAYFKADLSAADKYAKLIDMNKTNPKDDLTKGNTTEHEHNYRVGGDYGENVDVLSKMFYASSDKGNPVPNYYAVIGRDSGYSRFRIRDSYDSHSLSIENNASLVETAYREVKTYLKPFISSQCYSSINNHAFYIEKEPENRTDKVYSTLGTCANTPTPYNGFKFENGGYVLDKTDDITQDRNKTKRDLFGKYMESCKINGQVFGEYYRKIWDKTAVTLTADFGLKDINIQGDGYANLKRFSQNELIAQGLLEPKDKEKVPAALYTAILLGSDNKPKGEIFNYYNVGDVLVSIYDNSWTDAHGDQTFDGRKGPDGNYWGSTCVINSTSNKHDEFGKVGCDVGMKDDQYVVLRYLPAKMEIAIAGLDNSKRQIGIDENGTAILADENIRNAFSFTYFNQPDVANSSHGAINQALLAPAQLQNLAYLNISADAYISSKVYPNVIATLYDGKKIDINGTSVARCGFANEFDLKISFNFDCQTNPADARCAAAAVVPTTLADDRGAYNYTPFKNKRAENNDTLDRFSINLPATTQFFTETQCDQNSIGSDSRCFKINSKDLNTETALGTEFQLPLPVKHALNLYSDISENSGLLNMKDSVSGFYNPKRDPFKLLATAFNQGRTVVHTPAGIAGNSARIYVNFDRMHKSPHRPLVIASTDFNVTNAVDNNKTITPASFNTTYNLLDTVNSETHTNSLNPVTLTTNEYMAKVRDEYGIDILGATNSSAYFVYGKANEISDGETLYSSFINTAIRIPINSMLYCGQYNNCTTLLGVPTLFNGITDGSRYSNGFVINEYDNYAAANILSEFVSAYNPESSIITSTRDAFTQNGVENTSYNSQQAVSGRVRVLTNPWLIYTPADSNTQIFVDSIDADGIPQYYNYFKLRFATQGDWGGHGRRKSDGDVVGNFIVTDDDLNKTSSRKNTKDINLNSGSRMDW